IHMIYTLSLHDALPILASNLGVLRIILTITAPITIETSKKLASNIKIILFHHFRLGDFFLFCCSLCFFSALDVYSLVTHITYLYMPILLDEILGIFSQDSILLFAKYCTFLYQFFKTFSYYYCLYYFLTIIFLNTYDRNRLFFSR